MLRRDNVRLSGQLEAMGITRREKDNEIARLQRELESREEFVMAQAERVAASNDRAARLRAERDDARTLAEQRGGIDPAEAAQTKAHLEQGRAAYRKLQAEYDQISQALDFAAQDRDVLHPVVVDWDRLCRMLHEATGGRPKSSRDRDTLETWHSLRPQLTGADRRRTDGGAGGTA